MLVIIKIKESPAGYQSPILDRSMRKIRSYEELLPVTSEMKLTLQIQTETIPEDIRQLRS